MKNLLKQAAIVTGSAALLMMLAVPSHAASLNCAKVGRFAYPVNENAVKVAKALSVKTCNGKAFKEAAKQLQASINLVKADSTLIQKVKQAAELNRNNRIKGAIQGISLN